MKKRKSLTLSRYWWTLAFFAILAETFSLLPPRDVPETRAPAPYRQGIIHVHSIYSDGGGTPKEIGEAGDKAGMDFVILTDHNSSKARAEGQEKAYGRTDLLVEMEASTQAGHCVVFFSQTEAVKLSDDAVVALAWQHFLGKDTRPGLFLAIAHPSNVKNPWTHLDRFPDGMEAVNFDSVWQRELSESFPNFASMVLVNPMNSFLGARQFLEIYPRDFTAWDGMNTISQGHFAYLAQDTHSKLQLNKQYSLHWPDYLESFKLASNIVYYDEPLAPDFDARKKQLYASIRAGRLAMTYHSVHPFSGNDWQVRCGEKSFRAGDEVPMGVGTRGKCEFVISVPPTLPYAKIVRLIKNGEPYKELTDAAPSLTIPVESEGVYRVEVWVKAHTWMRILLNRPTPYVFYNPIYIR